ncbi:MULTISPECIES: LuxR C-terminal-related transcriptional regulator [Chryseobacterium]|uniref:LuxR C-terminal-related transcriptional regulator n=1 Tax=Chryseobacterium TaxID=59732 RepID=UPI000788FF89|nr:MULTISPECIES: LuxR C-terminal-related transcriptional regulator [Chryseobacterium]KYH07686.1 helix-turn-helix transcriptional regulator [Chryseobacterium cucumeris]WFB68036.1 LuxR C-terminal-related transcriptional regulator [Chryseobacterium sp. WX]WNI37099.1 LuxR C-terminal-related transcriptional regulator [Chryseobacterium sp. SG20098]
MEIREQLSDQLLDSALKKCQLDLEIYKQRALAYSQMEGAICVLSDMQENKSFIYKSAAADELGLKMEENPAEIDSIWEEDMLKKIHPDDRLKKYIHELRFFKLLETMEIEERTAYSVVSKIRMKDKNEDYRWVKHRMFYIYSPDNGRLRLALCLYNIALTSSGAPDFMIVNIIKGEVVVKDKLDYKNILSPRELEVLKCVGEGYASKEIAGLLSISVNTVNRHRQNILEKLKVKNSIQAFKDSFS